MGGVQSKLLGYAALIKGMLLGEIMHTTATASAAFARHRRR